jgi:hypothetical protein
MLLIVLRANNEAVAAAGLTRLNPNDDRFALSSRHRHIGLGGRVVMVTSGSFPSRRYPPGPIPGLDFGLYGLEWHLVALRTISLEKPDK